MIFVCVSLYVPGRISHEHLKLPHIRLAVLVMACCHTKVSECIEFRLTSDVLGVLTHTTNRVIPVFRPFDFTSSTACFQCVCVLSSSLSSSAIQLSKRQAGCAGGHRLLRLVMRVSRMWVGSGESFIHSPSKVIQKSFKSQSKGSQKAVTRQSKVSQKVVKSQSKVEGVSDLDFRIFGFSDSRIL